MCFEPIIRLKTFKASNLDYFDLIRSWNRIECWATPLGGNLTVNMDCVDYGPLCITERSNGCAAVFGASSGKNTVMFHLPYPDQSSVDLYQALPGGEQFNPFRMSGTALQWVVPKSEPLLYIGIDIRFMRKVLGGRAVENYFDLCGASTRKAFDADNLLQSALAAKSALESGFIYKQKKEKINEKVVADLLSAILLPLIFSDINEASANTRHNILKKSLNYIGANFDKPITISEIANAASTSVRNLQITFKSELGVTPNKFVQLHRLHKFRLMLLNANSVNEAARRCGVNHVGRLIDKYYKAFSRYPKEDLFKDSGILFDIGGCLN